VGLTGARFAAAPFKDQTKGYYQQLSRLSANLAFLSDMAMGTLGGELKRKERVSARLGDVLSQLYLASSALKRYQDEGRQQADLPLLHWALQDALFKAQEAIDELLRNFPNRWIGLGPARHRAAAGSRPEASRATSWTARCPPAPGAK
jgi:acyl-CoA dehydrogenase